MTEIDKRDGDKSMGKVVWHVTMSLDGFIAGPDDTVDWIFDYDTGPNSVAEETIKTTGAILVGRRWNALAMSRLGSRPEGGWLTTGCRRRCSAALRNAADAHR